MQVKEFRTKTEKELMAFIKTSKESINKTSMELLKGKEKNVKKLGNIKKDIARAQTVLAEKLFLKEVK